MTDAVRAPRVDGASYPPPAAAAPPGPQALPETPPRAVDELDRSRRARPQPTAHPLDPAIRPVAAARVAGPSVDARTVVDGLRRQGFTCTSAPDGSARCRGTLAGYPGNVNLFVPASFQRSASVAVGLHLHGHLLGKSIEDAVFQQRYQGTPFHFGSAANRAGFNGIVVVPESADHEATFNAWAANPTQVTRTMNALSTQLRDAGAVTTPAAREVVRSIALTGHSGAYVPIGALMRQPDFMRRVDAVGLFDANYGGAVALGRGGREVVRNGGLFVNINISGTGTQAHADALRDIVTPERPATTITPTTHRLDIASRGAHFYGERASEENQHFNLLHRRIQDFWHAFQAR